MKFLDWKNELEKRYSFYSLESFGEFESEINDRQFVLHNHSSSPEYVFSLNKEFYNSIKNEFDKRGILLNFMVETYLYNSDKSIDIYIDILKNEFIFSLKVFDYSNEEELFSDKEIVMYLKTSEQSHLTTLSKRTKQELINSVYIIKNAIQRHPAFIFAFHSRNCSLELDKSIFSFLTKTK